MRRVILASIVLIVILCLPASQDRTITNQDIQRDIPQYASKLMSTADAGGAGVSLTSTQNMSRTLADFETIIANSESDLNHKGSLDLSTYSIPGWTLFNAEIEVDNITAIPEREALTVSPNDYMLIENDTDGTLLITDSLYQGFYNQPFDGRLENYSIVCLVQYYLPGSLGKAYMVVRSDYSDPLTNETSWMSSFTQDIYDATYTHDTSADGAILNASTTYYVLIDGSAMNQVGSNFNKIFWKSRNTQAGFDTGYYLRNDDWYPYLGSFDQEAVLNYTYTPWNTTSDSPLVFSGPSSVDLKGNTTPLSGFVWDFENQTGLNEIAFTSNQSIKVFHNLTLWYQKSVITTTTWNITDPGNPVEWNVTETISYPAPSGALSYYLNVSKPSDWTPLGIYNSTSPSTDHDNIIDYGTSVTISSMTNGTWTLVCSAYNYLTDLQVPSTADITSNIDIISTIEDESSVAATTGTTNMTVWHEGIKVYAPSNQSVSSGSTTYTWDIDTTTGSNGTYIVEEYWTNGLEAGYLAVEIVVYYPTSLIAASSTIQAYTEDSFEIRVDFSKTFGPPLLTASDASVVFTYDSGSNVSMSDDWANGTWRATVDTTGNASGAHAVVVYAEGFAIENQSVTIDVILTHETLPLIYEWSAPNENNISYFENTNLTVWYRLLDGTNITDATVNITDGSTTWNLVWNPTSEGYRIQFNGTDFSSLPDTFSFTAKAWKTGYEYQENSSISLIVREEVDTELSVDWTPSDLSLTYIGQIRVIANYSYGGAPILGSTVSVSFNGTSPQFLTYNASDGLWYIIIPAESIDLGTWNISLLADCNGFTPMTIQDVLYIVEDTPILSSSWPADSEITDYDTPIEVNITITDSLGSPVISSNVTATLQGNVFNMTHVANGIYTTSLIPEQYGGEFTVVVVLTEYGFETTSITLDLTVLAVPEFIIDVDNVYETEVMTVSIQFVDSANQTSILGAGINLTIASTTYQAVYEGSAYVVRFNATLVPNFYPIDIIAVADGCRTLQHQISIEVLQKTAVYITLDLLNAAVEGGAFGIQATLRENVSDNVVRFAPIHFEVWVNFDNGTVIYAFGDDSTNENGVALWQYIIPVGGENRVEDIDIRVSYDGPVQYWDVEVTRTEPITVDPLMGLFLFLFFGDGLYLVVAPLVIAAVAATAYNKRIKPKKRAARVALDHQLGIFRDLEAMQHFMAVYVDRGTCVFYHPFKNARIQADLISGFISAVTSVYGEIKGEDGVQGTLEEIHYQGLRLNSYSGEYVLGILILEKEISPLLRDRLQFFIEIFENEYETHLKGWTGIVDCFDPEWIVSNLMTTFSYDWVVPHTIDDSVKMNGTEKKIIGYIKASLGEKLEREFSIGEYLQPIASMLKISEAEALDIFLKMDEKGIINPINVHTILMRQGLGLSGVDELVEEFVQAYEHPEDQGAEELIGEELHEQPTPEEQETPQEEPEQEEAVEEQPSEPEEKEEIDERDQFIADVESLLKKEKDENGEDKTE